jgi:hypothetical protein
MLGTISLIFILIAGYFQLTFWLLIPAAIVNSFLGLHFPTGKAQLLSSRGQYWSTFMASLPLQALLAAVIFGAGYGVGMLLA